MPRLVARRVALAGLELNNVSHSIVKNARSGYDDIWSMSRAGYNGYNDLR